MELLPMLSILELAGESGYAQGAFNVTSLQQVRKVLEVHDAMRSPAILQVGNIALGYLGGAADMNKSTLEERRRGALNVVSMVRACGESVDVPAAIHADHVKDIETIDILLESGFTSVMIDGSSLPFGDNVELTREVVKRAHAIGVTVEGELGVLAGMEDDVFSDRSSYTNPLDAVEFVEKTGVDCLALAYGTKHGVKKGKNIHLRKEIVIAARENLRHRGLSTILVSHGSSTVPTYVLEDFDALGGRLGDAGGVPIDQLLEVIRCGIGKINIDTDLRLCVARNVREYLSSREHAGLNGIEREVWGRMSAAPSEIDFRSFLAPLERNLIDRSVPVPEDAREMLLRMEKGIAEIVGTLLVRFGSVGKANRIPKRGLEECAAAYRSSSIKR